MVQHCQTFLWGGEGVANYDDVNSSDFTCDCEDGVWSDFNILGRPSCVPTKAHLVFGAIGLATSMAGMLHAAYQLNRQVMYSSGFPGIGFRGYALRKQSCGRRFYNSQRVIYAFLVL